MLRARAKKDPSELFQRNNEIRLRDISDETFKALDVVKALLHEKTAPPAILRLIHGFEHDRQTIAGLQKQNEELRRGIARYIDRENDMSQLIREFIRQTDRFNKMTTSEADRILKKFVTQKKKKAPAKKAAAKKKGGKK